MVRGVHVFVYTSNLIKFYQIVYYALESLGSFNTLMPRPHPRPVPSLSLSMGSEAPESFKVPRLS